MEQETALLLEAISALRAEVVELRAQLDTEPPADDALVIAPGQLWATGEQLAHRFEVSPEWVAARPRELGAAPISDCSNSKLRYYLATADAYMEGRIRQPKRGAARPSRSRRHSGGKRAAAPRLGFV